MSKEVENNVAECVEAVVEDCELVESASTYNVKVIGIVGVAVAAVVGVTVLAVKNKDKIREFVSTKFRKKNKKTDDTQEVVLDPEFVKEFYPADAIVENNIFDSEPVI